MLLLLASVLYRSLVLSAIHCTLLAFCPSGEASLTSSSHAGSLEFSFKHVYELITDFQPHFWCCLSQRFCEAGMW